MISSAAHNGPKRYTASKATRVVDSMPAEVTAVEVPDSEVLDFRANFEDRSPLDEFIREGALRMLQSTIEVEVDDFIAGHAQRTDEHGRRRVVRNGSLPEREILMGAGKLAESASKKWRRLRADHSGHPGTIIH